MSYSFSEPNSWTGNKYRSWYSINNSATVSYNFTLNSENLDSITMYFSNPDANISASLSKQISWKITGADSASGSFTIGSLSNNNSWGAGTIYDKTIYPNITTTSGNFTLTISSTYTASENTGLACDHSMYNWEVSTSSASVTSNIYYYNDSSPYDNDTHTGTDGDEFTYYLVSAPSKTGYTFKGWGTSASASTTYSAGASRKGYYGTDYYWYANWTANIYTITYNYVGGSGSSTSKSVTYNNTYGTLPIPTKTGYIFDGWYTSVSGGVIITSTTIVTTASDHTLYAHWTPKEYPVLYNGNGGFHSSGEKTWKDEINTFTFNEEESVSLEDIGNKDFKKVGYELLGWNSFFAAKLPLKTYTIVEDKEPELFAIWKAKSNLWTYQNGKWRLSLPYIYHNGKWCFCLYKIHKDLFVEVLEDFEYTIPFNSSTATITEWKETYQGESSNELIIPNNSKIIL